MRIKAVRFLTSGVDLSLDIRKSGKSDSDSADLELTPFEDKVSLVEEDEFVKILLDLTLYQYLPLTKSALSLLFRHMRPNEELYHTLSNVQLLTKEKDVEVFTSTVYHDCLS